jgi:uncharacterized protein
MAKPSGSVCNIDCEYCFYLEKEMLYPERQSNWRMSDDTLEQFIRQQIEAQTGAHVDIAWQGGEPTLMGLDFFKKAVLLCEKYKKNKTVRHAFQTNGILLNDEWCSFLKKNHFLVGLSIDGPQDLHDKYRVTRSKKGTHSQAEKAIQLLKKHGIEFNTLTVISDANVAHPTRVYEYLTGLGSQFLQFIPLVERESSGECNPKNSLAAPDQLFAPVTRWSVKAKEYGRFLNAIFDRWVSQDVGQVFVQNFDSALASWLGQPASVCIFAEQCGHVFALESNGDLYQCDHYVYPEYLLGNIHQHTIRELNSNPEAMAFGLNKKQTLNSQCIECKYRFACNGGCPKQRFERGPSGKPDHNYLCEGYYHHFEHIDHSMSIMASLLRKGRPAAEIMTFMAQKKQHSQAIATAQNLGRNSPCPCGSQRKFKQCCGKTT